MGVNLLNHTRTSPFSVVGNAFHIISYGTPCRSKRVLNDSRWSKRYFDPSYASTYGILNLAEKGKDMTSAMKGESIRWTSLSKLVDTRPSKALIIIISIFSIIICISCAMCNAPTSSSEGQLVSLLVPSTNDIALFLVVPFLVIVHRGMIVVAFVLALSIILIVWLLIIPLLQLSFQLMVPLSEPFNRYGEGLHLSFQRVGRVPGLLVGNGH